MGTKIKCLKCNDIIEGDGKGHLINCSCGACFVDETKYYCRMGGDPINMMLIEDGKEIPMVQMVNENGFKQDEPNTTIKVIYIFLDIDGVLNDETYIDECWEKNGNRSMSMNHVPFDPKALNNLMLLCQALERHNCTIRLILSSTWRLNIIDYEIVDARLAEYGLSLSGKTPVCNHERGKEIQQYLKENPGYDKFVILDDESFDIAELFGKQLIKTSFKTGFDEVALKKALKYFNIKE